MSDIPVGALDGGEVDGPNGEKYYLSCHGYDNANGWDVDYNNIRYNDDNRWHLQGHIDDTLPYSGMHFAYHCNYVNYYIEHLGTNGLTSFKQMEPNQSQLDNNSSMRFPYSGAFTVTAAYAPYLTATAQALITLNTSGGGDLVHDPYDYLDWYIPIYGMAIPYSQDDGRGVRFDVHSQADNDDGQQYLLASSELSYLRADGYGYDIFTTGTAYCQPYYAP